MPKPANDFSPLGTSTSCADARALGFFDLSRLSPFTRAAILMIMAMLLYSCVDTSVKLASQSIPTLQVVWFRFFAHFIAAFLFLNPWRSPDSWKMHNKRGQLARAGVQILTAALSFVALGHLQISQTTTLQFTTPMFVTLLSVLFLREHVGKWHWIGIFMAFGGVLIVMRPGIDGFDWAFIASIGSVFCAAIYNILTRHLSHTESAGSLLLAVGGFATIAIFPALPFVWVWPQTSGVWILLFAVGVFAAAGHYCLILAHQLAGASSLAPFQYIQFLIVLLFGYMFFNDIPTLWTFAGTAVIVASGVVIIRYGRRAEVS